MFGACMKIRVRRGTNTKNLIYIKYIYIISLETGKCKDSNSERENYIKSVFNTIGYIYDINKTIKSNYEDC
jgi:hypothetical protein